ncbi:melatonin receptor type 1C-like [Acropora millepora]|uniref:melatonin receptor type 1C-like n=1 Tax=Acropora millepora TaxID=45264 RepID=UPI001CF4CEEE|nr:melatonin receptor type 1C-like [Acropora millepora]
MSNDLGSRIVSITVVEVTALIILNVLSLAGNILIFISAYTNKRLRTATNLYIIALAVSDLISALIVMPLSTGVLISGKWIYGDAVCQLHAFFSLFAIYVSSVTMGLTAVNRYTRMCKSDMQYKKWFSMKKSRMLLAFVWMFVACYTSIPRLVGLQRYDFVPGYAQCSIMHLSDLGKKIHYGIVIPLFFLTPLTATIFCYAKVGKMIRQHNTSASATLKFKRRSRARVIIRRQFSGRSKFSAHEIKLSKSLFAVVFTFMICWIPIWIIVILRRFPNLVGKMPRNVELFCAFLFYLSNTINPFIYAGMNPAFRREFRKILLCKRWPQLAVQSASTEGKLTRTENSQEIVINSQNSESLLRLHWVTSPMINSPSNRICRMRHVGVGPSTSETSC